MKFLDGSPVPDDYSKAVAKLVREAADGDPGEENEPVREDEPTEQDRCAHRWVYTGTQYGGDDESYRGEGRCYCELCGADGDA